VKQVIKHFKNNSKAGQKGVAAVEMAILLPFFGILLLGILEIGGMAHDYQVLENAAREGARFSALPNNSMATSPSPSTVETRIKNRIIAYLANERITVAAGDITVNQNYEMTVGSIKVRCTEITVNYARKVMFPGIGTWLPLGTSTTLKGTAVFRNFY
jgi:Flp pilus assembly protein TadG